MNLNDTKIKNLQPGPRASRYADGEGLYLEVTAKKANGKVSKHFRVRYRFGGKENIYTIGKYPTVSLKEAREQNAQVKKWLSDGLDPNTEKKKLKAAAVASVGLTFEVAAKDWIAAQTPHRKKATVDKYWWCLEAIPAWFKALPIEDIDRTQAKKVLEPYFQAKLYDKTKRVARFLEAVFFDAYDSGKIVSSPAENLTKSFKFPKKLTAHHPAIFDLNEFGKLLFLIEESDVRTSTRLALLFGAHTAARPGEVRGARWEEIDFEKEEWVIPEERMKGDADAHVVPLSKQSLAILKEAKKNAGKSEFVFPAQGKPNTPLSENTPNHAIWRLGYKGKQTMHGFRRTFSTTMNERGYNADWVEAQLSHVEKDSVRASYNSAEYMKHRTEMMQDWSDLLEQKIAKAQQAVVAKGGA